MPGIDVAKSIVEKYQPKKSGASSPVENIAEPACSGSGVSRFLHCSNGYFSGIVCVYCICPRLAANCSLQRHGKAYCTVDSTEAVESFLLRHFSELFDSGRTTCTAAPLSAYNGIINQLNLENAVDIDQDKIDDAALALMYLTLHDNCRAWKQIDWKVTNRLHEKGLIADPVGKAKSVIFTAEGLKKSEQLFNKLFSK